MQKVQSLLIFHRTNSEQKELEYAFYDQVPQQIYQSYNKSYLSTDINLSFNFIEAMEVSIMSQLSNFSCKSM